MDGRMQANKSESAKGVSMNDWFILMDEKIQTKVTERKQLIFGVRFFGGHVEGFNSKSVTYGYYSMIWRSSFKDGPLLYFISYKAWGIIYIFYNFLHIFIFLNIFNKSFIFLYIFYILNFYIYLFDNFL